MNVKLIGYTPDPEKMPAMAAKLTHSKTKPEDLDKTSSNELKAILEHVVNLGHASVVEHTSFTFAISGVSRSLTHQLVRHRIASYSQQSERYNRFFDSSIKNLQEKFKRYNINNKRRKECKFTLGDEYKILDEYEEGASSIELEKKYNCCSETILNIIKAHGKKVRGNNESVVNHNFFDLIDTHLKAQMLGVLFADGFLGKNKEHYFVGIKLQEYDKDYLEDMRKIICLKRPLYFYSASNDRSQNMYQLTISSKRMYDRLMRYGLKKGNREVPKAFNKAFLNSFILGYFEGDGSVGRCSGNKNWLTFISGSQEFLIFIKEGIIENYDVPDVKILKKTRSYHLSWQGKKDVEEILLWMYKNMSLDFVLKRKFFRCCELYPKIDELRREKILERCDQDNVVIPPSTLKNIYASDIYLRSVGEMINSYITSCGIGIRPEDSRFILPQGFKTNIIVTMNARSLLNFFELRCCQHAQWEIRTLANKMLAEVKKVAPTIFKHAGPPCKTRQVCPEQKKDCPLYPM